MKKLLRALVMIILSGLVFDFVFLNSIDISTDSIVGSIFDHASPESKENYLADLKQMCDTLDLVSENPEIVLEADPSIDLEKLGELCQRDLDDRELFIEFFKSQTGGFEEIFSQKTDSSKYNFLFSLEPRDKITSLGLIGLFTILLFLIEENHHDFFRSLNKILIMVSVCAIITYFLPKIMAYFINIDTSFLLELSEETVNIIGPNETILILLPIILEQIFTDSLLVYALVTFGLYLVIKIFIKVKRNKLITVNNNNTENWGP